MVFLYMTIKIDAVNTCKIIGSFFSLPEEMVYSYNYVNVIVKPFRI